MTFARSDVSAASRVAISSATRCRNASTSSSARPLAPHGRARELHRPHPVGREPLDVRLASCCVGGIGHGVVSSLPNSSTWTSACGGARPHPPPHGSLAPSRASHRCRSRCSGQGRSAAPRRPPCPTRPARCESARRTRTARPATSRAARRGRPWRAGRRARDGSRAPQNRCTRRNPPLASICVDQRLHRGEAGAAGEHHESRPGPDGSVRWVPTAAPARSTSPRWVLWTMAVLTGPPPTRRTWSSNDPSGAGSGGGCVVAPQARAAAAPRWRSTARRRRGAARGARPAERRRRRAPLDVDHGRGPTTGAGRHRVGGADHHLGDDAVGGGPVLRHVERPVGAAEVLERGQQRLADGGVVVADDREAAVVAPELLQHGHDRVEVVDAADHLAEGADELVALVGHADREHLADVGVVEEEVRVEEQRDLVAVRGDLAPALLQADRVDHATRSRPGRSRRCRPSPRRRRRRPRRSSSSSAPRSVSTATRWPTTLS